MNLLHLLVNQWRRRPARTALSVASVGIAVAAVLATAIAQSSVRVASKQLSQEVEGRPALEIISTTGGRFAAADVPSLIDIPGVDAAVPIVVRGTKARFVKGEVRQDFRGLILGVPVDEPAAWASMDITAGRGCEKEGEVVMSAELAEGLGAGVDDRLLILTRDGPQFVTIVGLVRSSSLRELTPGVSLVIPLSEVQDSFHITGEADRVRVLIADIEQRAAAQAEIAKRLPANLIVQLPVQQMELAKSILLSTELALQFAGALSVAMAAFIILNTLQMNFSERRRDMAAIRLVGATKRQVFTLHLAEGACMGLAGSVLGIPAGFLLGRGLWQVMQRVVVADVPAAQAPLSAWILALVLGPLIACVAALIPAARSRKVSAMEALSEAELKRPERFPVWGIVTAGITWSIACVLLLLVVLERIAPEAAIPAGLLMLISFVMLIPLLLRPLARAMEWLLSPLLKTEGSLATEQLLQRATRAGLTVGVLVVAINNGLGLGNAIINNVNDIRQWFRRTMAGDVILSNPSAGDSPATAVERGSLRDEIAQDPSVEYVVELRIVSGRVNDVSAACIVRDFLPEAELPWVLTAKEETELRHKLREGEAAVSSLLARNAGIKEGDTVRIEVGGRVHTVRVAVLVNDYTLGGLGLFLDREAATQMMQLGEADLYIVQAKPGAPTDEMLAGLQAIGQREGLIVQSFSQFRSRIDRLINGIVYSLWGLLAVGFIIAGMGVANTLTMSVLEQTRELGLLRVIGMTRGQIRKLVACESVMLGVVGAVVGTVAGITTSVVIHWCNEPLMGRTMPYALHFWLVAANAGGCLVVAMLAAWTPSERAARLNLLSAIAYE